MPETKTIAILSPGEMGSAVGRALNTRGVNTITCLDGRSQRTKELAQKAGFRDVSPLSAMVKEADLILSILVPAQAAFVTQEVANAIRRTGVKTPFADCNAVSPQTSYELNRLITEAGSPYIDASIIGGPPSESESTRFYVSGPHTSPMQELDGMGITVKAMGNEIGKAKAIKMCYAGMTKGSTALYTALLTAAEALGVSEELNAEFEDGHKDVLRRMQGIRRTPAVAHRWIGEMEEIAATFENIGVTPYFHNGAASIYRMVATSPLGNERPEDLDPNRTLGDVIRLFAEVARSKKEEEQKQ